jgi:hypothetical protein
MRLCTICISCIDCLPLPKRALLLAEPPPNRLQLSEQTVTSTITPAAHRSSKETSQKHLNSFSFSAKGHAAFTVPMPHLGSAIRVPLRPERLGSRTPDRNHYRLLFPRRGLRLPLPHICCQFLNLGQAALHLAPAIPHRIVRAGVECSLGVLAMFQIHNKWFLLNHRGCIVERQQVRKGVVVLLS